MKEHAQGFLYSLRRIEEDAVPASQTLTQSDKDIDTLDKKQVDSKVWEFRTVSLQATF